MKVFHKALPAVFLLTAAMLFAQAKEGDIVANIPFSFVVAGRTLSPGHYIVNRVGDSELRIHNVHNQGVLVPAHSAQRPPSDRTTKLVFHRYGDIYFLVEVWGGGGETLGRALFRSRAESELIEGGREQEVAVVRPGK